MAAAAAVLGLDAARAQHAVALAATQSSGLTASFGTMAKPFHAGKAAMDGVLSAQLAAGGFTGAPGLLEAGGGLDNAVIQDGSLSMAPVEFSDWRILRNSFKPYAACHLIHPAIDAARALSRYRNDIRAVRVDVGALALKVTGGGDGRPTTSLAAKFDMRHCVALALHGGDVSAADFREPWSGDPAVAATAALVSVRDDPAMGFATAALTVETASGAHRVHVPVAKGHPGNPMTWDDMAAKFDGLTAPVLAGRGGDLFALARRFGGGDSLTGMSRVLGSLA